MNRLTSTGTKMTNNYSPFFFIKPGFHLRLDDKTARSGRRKENASYTDVYVTGVNDRNE